MSTLTDKPKKLTSKDGMIFLEMESGLMVSFALSKNRKLSKASKKQIQNVELSPFGIHWPELDEDLSIAGILAGRFDNPN